MILVSALSVADETRPNDSGSERRRARGLPLWFPAVAAPKRWRPSWIARRFWRDLEIVLCWIFLDAQERAAHPLSSRIRAPMRSKPAPTKAADRATIAPDDSPLLIPDAMPSKPRREVLLAGRAKFTDGLLRCLLSEDVNVHAIAVDLDEARDLITMGATPHLLEDIPDQAAHFDVVISTDLMQFISADVLARLPEHAVILDVAPPPGSVDYESAKALRRKAIWARPAVSEGRAVFCPEAWAKVRRVLEMRRHGD
ncbi:hypothetical protein CCR94_21465 [Rhodoblastus sphagnicola]|uniref:Uncharacterized protein n=1 Tax=Rhodoblastus sphagnicola TaxID=333368 RepID=A0A2S6MXB5_9HYPH|nr:hypothetical protein [Rhodoblastus sphagnicola]MBB4199331.1 hypothetical protein [Rhodoblastus sphagnicola]PPQ26989.1 hypothetical protein CCR94_21465 [Rhodoblastus sphagnicola]